MPPSHKSLIYGRHPIIEALSGEKVLDRILMHHTANGEGIGEIVRLAKEKNTPVIRVPLEKLNSLVRSNHQGVIAYGAIVHYTPLQEVISHVYDAGRSPFLLLLDGITDVRNAGAIIRSAVCFGVDAIIQTEKNSAPLHEDMVKTSAGALMKINFCREKNIQQVVDILKLNGIRLLSSEVSKGQPIAEIDFTQPTCVVMGSEDKGVSNLVQEHCDEHILIPMQGEFDSLNVSVATGIICYEASKKRASL